MAQLTPKAPAGMNALNSPNSNILKANPQFNLKSSFEKDILAIKPVDLSALAPVGAFTKSMEQKAAMPAPYAKAPEVVKTEVAATEEANRVARNKAELEKIGLPADFKSQRFEPQPSVTPDFSYARQPSRDEEITRVTNTMKAAGIPMEEIQTAIQTRVLPKLEQRKPTIEAFKPKYTIGEAAENIVTALTEGFQKTKGDLMTYTPKDTRTFGEKAGQILELPQEGLGKMYEGWQKAGDGDVRKGLTKVGAGAVDFALSPLAVVGEILSVPFGDNSALASKIINLPAIPFSFVANAVSSLGREYGMEQDEASDVGTIATGLLALKGGKKAKEAMIPKEVLADAIRSGKDIIEAIPKDQRPQVVSRLKDALSDKTTAGATKAKEVLDGIREQYGLQDKSVTYKPGDVIPKPLGAAVKEFRATSEPPSAVKKAITEGRKKVAEWLLSSQWKMDRATKRAIKNATGMTPEGFALKNELVGADLAATADNANAFKIKNMNDKIEATKSFGDTEVASPVRRMAGSMEKAVKEGIADAMGVKSFDEMTPKQLQEFRETFPEQARVLDAVTNIGSAEKISYTQMEALLNLYDHYNPDGIKFGLDGKPERTIINELSAENRGLVQKAIEEKGLELGYDIKEMNKNIRASHGLELGAEKAGQRIANHNLLGLGDTQVAILAGVLEGGPGAVGALLLKKGLLENEGIRGKVASTIYPKENVKTSNIIQPRNRGATPAPKSRVGRIMDTFDSTNPSVQIETPKIQKPKANIIKPKELKHTDTSFGKYKSGRIESQNGSLEYEISGKTMDIDIVKVSNQGKGEGTRLMQEAERIANEKGLDKIQLSAQPLGNTSTFEQLKSFYEKNGYKNTKGDIFEKNLSKSKILKYKEIVVYRGLGEGAKKWEGEYFTTDKNIAKTYGENVKEYKIKPKNIADFTKPSSEISEILRKNSSNQGFEIEKALQGKDTISGTPMYEIVDQPKVKKALKEAGYDFIKYRDFGNAKAKFAEHETYLKL